MKEIAKQHKVSISGPNDKGVCELSTSGKVGTALPTLVQDVYSCVKVLIKKDFQLAPVDEDYGDQLGSQMESQHFDQDQMLDQHQ